MGANLLNFRQQTSSEASTEISAYSINVSEIQYNPWQILSHQYHPSLHPRMSCDIRNSGWLDEWQDDLPFFDSKKVCRGLFGKSKLAFGSCWWSSRQQLRSWFFASDLMTRSSRSRLLAPVMERGHFWSPHSMCLDKISMIPRLEPRIWFL